MKKLKDFLVLATLIFLILLFNFRRTLSFSLAGDDWGALYYYYKHFTGFKSYFNLSNYMGNYDGANIIMGEISKLFNFNPFFYYLTSMIARFLASISFVPMIKKLTKNNFAAYFSAVLFSSLYTGAESTNWVFNMASYFSIFFFNMFLFIYDFKSKIILTIKVFISMFFLFISFYLMPIRMHGAILSLPIALILLHKSFNKKVSIKLIFTHLALLLSHVLYFYGVTATRYQSNYVNRIMSILKLPYHLFFLPFSYLGAVIVPDKVLTFFIKNISRPDIDKPNVFLLFSISFLLITFFITNICKATLKLPNKFTKLTTLFTSVSYLLFWFTLGYDRTGIFDNLVVVIDVFIGIYVFGFFAFYFYFLIETNKAISFTGLYFLVLSFVLVTVPWIVFPNGTVYSDSRYLLVPGAYLVVCLSLVFSQLNAKNIKTPLYLGIVLFFIANIYSLNKYFNFLSANGRLQTDHERVASVINSEVPVLDDKNVSVFLFTGPEDGYIYNTIRFGFPYYMLFTHKELIFNVKNAPFPVDNIDSLIDVVGNPHGEEIKRYGYADTSIKIENIYSFQIDRENIENKSEEVRRCLTNQMQ